MTISIRRLGGLAGYFYFTDNAGNTINPSQHIIGRDHFTKMSHELRIASPADNPAALRRRPVLPAPDPPHPSGLSGHRPRLGHVGQRLPGHALADPAGPRRPRLCGVRRAELRHRADPDPDRRPSRLSLRQQPDRLLRLRPQSGRAAVQRRRQLAHRRRRLLHHHRRRACATIRAAPCCRAVVPGSPCTDLATFNNGNARAQARPRATASPTASTSPGTSRPTICSTRPGRAASGRAASTAAARSPPYQKDTLTNYEIGFKTSGAAASRLNGALYRQDWRSSNSPSSARTASPRSTTAPTRGSRAPSSTSTGGRSTASASRRAPPIPTPRRGENLCLFDDPTFTCARRPAQSRLGARRARACRSRRASSVGARRATNSRSAAAPAMSRPASTHQSSASSDLRTAIIQPGTGDIVNPAALTGRLTRLHHRRFRLRHRMAPLHRRAVHRKRLRRARPAHPLPGMRPMLPAALYRDQHAEDDGREESARISDPAP